MNKGGKDWATPGWVAAYLEAARQAKETGETVRVPGFERFKVSPPKDRDKEP